MRYNTGQRVSFVVCVCHKIIKVSGAGMVNDGCEFFCDPLIIEVAL